jgi:hypothetical protein
MKTTTVAKLTQSLLKNERTSEEFISALTSSMNNKTITSSIPEVQDVLILLANIQGNYPVLKGIPRFDPVGKSKREFDQFRKVSLGLIPIIYMDHVETLIEGNEIGDLDFDPITSIDGGFLLTLRCLYDDVLFQDFKPTSFTRLLEYAIEVLDYYVDDWETIPDEKLI